MYLYIYTSVNIVLFLITLLSDIFVFLSSYPIITVSLSHVFLLSLYYPFSLYFFLVQTQPHTYTPFHFLSHAAMFTYNHFRRAKETLLQRHQKNTAGSFLQHCRHLRFLQNSSLVSSPSLSLCRNSTCV